MTATEHLTRSRSFSWADPSISVEAARGRSGLELMQALLAGDIPPPPITQALGFRLAAAEPGEVVPGYLDLLLRPDAMWRLAGLVAEHGRFRFGSVTVGGVPLWGLWLLEAVCVVWSTT